MTQIIVLVLLILATTAEHTQAGTMHPRRVLPCVPLVSDFEGSAWCVEEMSIAFYKKNQLAKCIVQREPIEREIGKTSLELYQVLFDCSNNTYRYDGGVTVYRPGAPGYKQFHDGGSSFKKLDNKHPFAAARRFACGYVYDDSKWWEEKETKQIRGRRSR